MIAAVTAKVRPQFLMTGERVHAPQSVCTWAGQIITVTRTRTATARGVVIVHGTDEAGRPVSFPVPLDGWAVLAD